MKPPLICAAVLAGGQDRRMRGDKALLPLGAKTLLQHAGDAAATVARETVVVSPDSIRRKGLAWPTVYDRRSGVGPLGGLEAALLNLSLDCLLVMACDMPFVSEDVLKLLVSNWDGEAQMVACKIDGVVHPAPALYRRDALFSVERLLARKDYDWRNIVKEVRVKIIPEEKVVKIDPSLRSFVNLNTQDAYQRYQLEAEGKPPLSF